MEKNIISIGPVKNFEAVKKINKDGVEYWEARELMSLFGYDKWDNFQKVIDKAKISCVGSNQEVDDHFLDVGKMIKIAKNTAKEAIREIKDYGLSRYACYLIAQNGDSKKQEIATAQTYFAIKTREREVDEQLTEDQKRLYIRKEVKTHNKKLFETAQDAGVNNFGKFNNYGYLGLYGLTSEQIQNKKGIGNDNVLDRAGSTELAANLFRITQTEDKLKKSDTKEEEIANATHFDVGQKVRKTIKDIDGTMPEDLNPEKHIKEIEKVEKKILKQNNKKRIKSSLN